MVMFPVIKGSAAANGRSRVIATINPKGKVDIASFREKKNYWAVTMPFFRGIAILIFGMYFFILSLNRSQMILGKEKKEQEIEDKIAKKLKIPKSVVYLSICGVIGSAIGLVGIVLIPYLILGALFNSGVSLGLSAFIIALIRTAMFGVILISLKMIPSMKQFYRNNSAGNLAMANYKDKRVDTHHLSTNFLNFIVCGLFLSFFVVSFMIIDLNLILRVLINILLILVCFSVVYELLKIFEFKNGLFSKILILPFSCFVNEKPTQTEREIAFSALNEVILMKYNEERLIGKTKDTEVAFSVIYSEVKDKLNAVGITDIADTEWLIAESLNKKRNDIKFLTHIGREDYRKIKSALAKREKRMPLSKIFNRTNFYGYDLYVDKNVLSPRPETEQLVDEALKIIKPNYMVLDLMTGSGAIAIALAKKTRARVYASDISVQALEVARKNAKNNKATIRFINSDVFKKFNRQKFDVIISNPPYISSKDILTLDDEVKKFDPLISLDGGEDGLYFYREISENAPKFLKSGGVLILEIGNEQGKDVKKLLQKKFENIRIKKDYSKNDRIITAKLKG